MWSNAECWPFFQDDSRAKEEKEEGDQEEMEETENRGKTSHDATGAVQSESTQDDAAGNNDQEEVRCV